MKINRLKLQKALEIVKPGLASKDVIEQSTSFAFMKGKVLTFNDEICMSHPLPEIEFAGAIEAQPLYSILNKWNQEEIQVIKEDSEIILECGRSKAGLVLQSEIKLPLEQIEKPSKWFSLPKEFVRLIEMTMGVCSKDMSRPILTNINVRKDGIIEASDSYRIIQTDLKTEMPVDTFLIPASTVAQVVRINPTKIALSKAWVYFKNEVNTEIACRIFADDKFPESSHLFKFEGKKIKFPKRLDEIMERASVFSDSEYILDEIVEIEIKNGEMLLSSNGKTGWYKERAKIRHKEKIPINFAVTPFLLKDILKETTDCYVGNDRMRFEGEDWRFIASLLSSSK